MSKKTIWIIIAIAILAGIGIFILFLPIIRPDLLYRSAPTEKEEETKNSIVQKGSIKLLRNRDHKIVFSFPREWQEWEKIEEISSLFFKEEKDISKISSIAGIYDPASKKESGDKFVNFSKRTTTFLLEAEFDKDSDLTEFLRPHLESYQQESWQVYVDEFPCPNCEYSQYALASLSKKSEEGDFNNTISFHFLTGKEENKIYAIESYGLRSKILEDGIGIIDEPYSKDDEEYYNQVSGIFESFQIED